MDLSDMRLPYNVEVQWRDANGIFHKTTAKDLQQQIARENIDIDIENMIDLRDHTSIRDAAGYLREDLRQWWNAWVCKWPMPGGGGSGGGTHDF